MKNLFLTVFQSPVATVVSFLVLGYLTARLICPWVIQFATRHRIFALQNARRRHERVTPLLGGTTLFVAIFLSFIAAWLGGYCADSPSSSSFCTFAISLTGIFLLGVWDDWKHLSAGPKLKTQILAAGFFLIGQKDQIALLQLPTYLLPVVYAFLAVLMIGIMNSVNLIDGIDGLCSGTGAINMIFLGIIAVSLGHQNFLFSLTLPALVGACIGFLYFNSNPAKVFLGDSGSLTLGFALAAMAVDLILTDRSILTAISVLLVLGHPILDTLTVMLIRAKAGRPIFSGDRNHLHHRLHRLGLSTKNVDAVLWGVSIYFGIQAIFLIDSPPIRVTSVLLSLCFLTTVSLLGLSFVERSLSLQMTRFGQALLGAQAPTYVEPEEFVSILQELSKPELGKTRGISLLVIDYMKMMPKMLREAPEKVDEFFRASHAVIRTNTRPDTLIARLSETTTVILIEDEEGDTSATKKAYDRIALKMHDLQAQFNITMSDTQGMEGVTLITYPLDFFSFLQRLNLNVSMRTLKKSLPSRLKVVASAEQDLT